MTDHRDLPVLETAGDGDAACGPKVYVSNEEAALLATMRRVREDALALRRELATVPAEERTGLERRLAELRVEWEALARRREAAYHRKMVMLGHAEPEVEWPAP